MNGPFPVRTYHPLNQLVDDAGVVSSRLVAGGRG